MDGTTTAIRINAGGHLIVGRRLRCPRCKNVDEVFNYFTFDRPENYADELNVVVKCRAKVRKRGGGVETCRCVFSPAADVETLP